ncbi:MAG: hypothetical protein M1838_003982 [Thelocarpon superellum]|nr:MAG: hypothetical protein M1838_003982 [Thelocarpon superellum]
MDTITLLKKTVVEYFSPGRNHAPQARRSSARSPQPPQRSQSMHSQLDRISMSPTRRTFDWLYSGTTPGKDPSRKVHDGRVTKRILPSPPPSKKSYRDDEPLKRSSGVDASDDGDKPLDQLDETTLIGEESIHVRRTRPCHGDEDDDEYRLDGDTLLDAEDEDEREEVAHMTEGRTSKTGKTGKTGKDRETKNSDGAVFNIAVERGKRLRTLKQVANQGWSEAELFLFQRITLRAFEPVLPRHWAMDFKTMPSVLFSRRDEKTYICSASGNDFRAQKALSDLMSLGSKVRASLQSGTMPDAMIKREYERYFKWAAEDGEFAKKDYIPLIAIATPTSRTRRLPHRVKSKGLEASMTRKLQSLAARHRAALAVRKSIEPSAPSTLVTPSASASSGSQEPSYIYTPPTLYGILISSATIAIVTYDASRPSSPLRPLALFDLSRTGQDVWNGFSIALLANAARDEMVKLDQVVEFADRAADRSCFVGAEEPDA